MNIMSDPVHGLIQTPAHVPGVEREVIAPNRSTIYVNPSLAVPRIPDYAAMYGRNIHGFAMQQARSVFINDSITPMTAPTVRVNPTPKRRFLVMPFPMLGLDAIKEP